jgi:hypothetical protein
MFQNMHFNLGDSFKQWRQNNVISNLSERLNVLLTMMISRPLSSAAILQILEKVGELREFLHNEMLCEEWPIQKFRDAFTV